MMDLESVDIELVRMGSKTVEYYTQAKPSYGGVVYPNLQKLCEAQLGEDYSGVKPWDEETRIVVHAANDTKVFDGDLAIHWAYGFPKSKAKFKSKLEDA